MKKSERWKNYLNIPYKHLGRDRDGIDCWGLPMLYYKELLNIEWKDWWYEPDWSKKGQNYFLDNYKDFHFERVDTPQKHDIVLLRMDIKSVVPNHAGIVVTPPNIVITANKHGVEAMDLSKSILKRRIEGFYRLCQN